MAVDNDRHMRTTIVILWTSCGHKKTRNELPNALAHRHGKAVEILSPLETGTVRGRPRDAGGTGKPAPRAGIRYWRAARGAGLAGEPAGQALRSQTRPPPSHTWRGPRSIPPD